MAIQFFATTSRGIVEYLYKKKTLNISNKIMNRSQPINTTIEWGNFRYYGNFGHHFVSFQFVLVLRYMVFRYVLVNTLWPSDSAWRHKTRSTVVQVMACYLMAPSHNLS